jgi:hypothetical protein
MKTCVVRVLPRLAAHFAGAVIALLFGIRLGAHVHVFTLDVSIGILAIPLSLSGSSASRTPSTSSMVSTGFRQASH